MAPGPKKAVQHAVVVEFETPEQLLKAANQAREAGFTKLEAYSPFPIHGLSEAIGFHDEKVPWIVAIGGLTGALAGMALQIYVSVIDYPMNVGGKPLLSLPAFIPVTFECTILFASFGAVFGMMALNGLPRPHHPIFDTPNFERASQDRFFLAVEAEDPKYSEAQAFLGGLTTATVAEVAA